MSAGMGTVLAIVASTLPFLGLARFAGDMRPVILAMSVMAVALGLIVFAWRPAVLESYVKLASLAFFVLMLLGVLGLLAQMDGSAMALR
ncbi:MAG: hypothetical protein WD534_05900 [Phycisphaeraceae bacterium]